MSDTMRPKPQDRSYARARAQSGTKSECEAGRVPSDSAEGVELSAEEFERVARALEDTPPLSPEVAARFRAGVERLRTLMTKRTACTTCNDTGWITSHHPGSDEEFQCSCPDCSGGDGMADFVPQVGTAPTWADGMERAAELCEEEAASARALLNESPHIGAMAKDRVSGIRNAMDLMAKTIRTFKAAGANYEFVADNKQGEQA